MRIAQIAPLYESVPPKLYGGTERVVAHLTNALVDLGHEVTLFAAADARVKGKVIVVRDQSIRLDAAPLKSDLAAHLTMLYEVERRAQQFDVLHFHVDMLHFTMFEQQAHKVITTLHGRLDLKDLAQAYKCWPQFQLVSISDDQRRPLPDANWIATVPHGFPTDLYKYCAPSGSYFAFLGRISPEKRPDIAIRLALRTGIPLKIAAKVDAVDVGYFESVVRPLLNDPLIEFIGEIGDDYKPQFLGDARCLLFPIDWPEPFGLVMIEAMACGTPVIAYRAGSVTEIIDSGVNGFVVQSIEEAVDAVSRVQYLDRKRCRETFEQRFSSARMAADYIKIYDRLVTRKTPRPQLSRSALDGTSERVPLAASGKAFPKK
jgi:glycosyltransferase involved in cell wall biosynthesis